MKLMKVVPLLLGICAALTLTACVGNVSEIRSYYTENRNAGHVAAQSKTGKPVSYVTETQTFGDEVLTPDGETLASWRYEIPVMGAYREDGSPITSANAAGDGEKKALQVIDTFNNAFEQWQTAADFPALEQTARLDYQWRHQEGEPWQSGYAQELDCALYQTAKLVSVAGCFYYNGGGVHPNTVFLGWNFDVENGTFFTPEQLFEDVDAVTAELVRLAGARAAAEQLPPEEFFWRDYADILALWSDSTVSVTFDADFMIISYSPYDLAAYAAGPQIFQVPRAWLEPYLSDYGKNLLS